SAAQLRRQVGPRRRGGNTEGVEAEGRGAGEKLGDDLVGSRARTSWFDKLTMRSFERFEIMSFEGTLHGAPLTYDLARRHGEPVEPRGRCTASRSCVKNLDPRNPAPPASPPRDHRAGSGRRDGT